MNEDTFSTVCSDYSKNDVIVKYNFFVSLFYHIMGFLHLNVGNSSLPLTATTFIGESLASSDS